MILSCSQWVKVWSASLCPICGIHPSPALVCGCAPFVLEVYRGAWCDVKLGRRRKKLHCHGNTSPSVSLWSLIHPGSENMKALLLRRHAALHKKNHLWTQWDNPFRLLCDGREGWVDGSDVKMFLDGGTVSDFLFILNDCDINSFHCLFKECLSLRPIYRLTTPTSSPTFTLASPPSWLSGSASRWFLHI